MILRFVTVRSVISRGILLTLCLALPAGSTSADMLMLTLPAILAKKQTPSGPSWQPPQLIETEVYDAGSPRVAIDATGNAIAVWMHVGSEGGYDILANRYETGTGWGTSQLIQENAGTAWGPPKLTIDAVGNVIAVWAQDDSGIDTLERCLNIWSNRYVPSSGWEGPQRIDTNQCEVANLPNIAIDGAGNALAVWVEGSNNSIWANRYVPGSGWGTAQIIGSNDVGSSDLPKIAINAAGNGFAVWTQHDGSQWNMWGNRYVAGSGWQTAQLIENNVGGGIVAVDEAGNAIVIWQQWDGSYDNIWANRYDQTTGSWGTAQLVETEAGTAWSPQLAVDAAGSTIAVWMQQSNDGTSWDIRSNRYVPGSGWEGAQLVENNSGWAFEPQVAADGLGNIIAVWQQDSNILTNRYETSSGWRTPQVIGTDGMSPQLAVNAAGNTVAVWQQWDDESYTYDIWAAWYK